MIGILTLPNPASEAFHQKFGFSQASTLYLFEDIQVHLSLCIGRPSERSWPEVWSLAGRGLFPEDALEYA